MEQNTEMLELLRKIEKSNRQKTVTNVLLCLILPNKVAAVAIMVLAFALSVLSVLPALDRVPFSLATAFYEIGTSWIFIFLYLLLAFAVLDLGRLLHIVPSSVLVNNAVGAVLLTVVMLSVCLSRTSIFAFTP